MQTESKEAKQDRYHFRDLWCPHCGNNTLEYLIQLTHGSERLLNQYAERQRISLTDAVRDYAEVLLMDAMGGEIKAAQHWCSHCLKSPIQVFRRIVSCLPARGIMPIDEELVQYVNNKYPESEWKEKT